MGTIKQEVNMKFYHYHKGVLITSEGVSSYTFNGLYSFINRKGQKIIKSTKEEIERAVDEDLKPPFRFFEDC